MNLFSYPKFRIPTRPRTAAFHRQIRSVRHRLRAVRTLLEGSPEQLKDAIPLLHGAFLDVLYGMVLDCVEHPQPRRELFCPHSRLRPCNATELVQMPTWLRVAAKQYYRFEPVKPTRMQITETIRTLHSQLNAVHHWREQRSERSVCRHLRKLTVVPAVLSGVLLAGTVAFGGYEYATRADETDGLSATYFSSTQFQGHPFMWIDNQLQFNWQQHAPFRTRKPFSVLWQGCIVMQASAKHVQLDTNADFTLRIDGTAFTNSAPTRAIPRGVHALTVELPTVRTPTNVTLKWNTPGAPPVPVPSKALIPLGGNERHDCSTETALQNKRGAE